MVGDRIWRSRKFLTHRDSIHSRVQIHNAEPRGNAFPKWMCGGGEGRRASSERVGRRASSGGDWRGMVTGRDGWCCMLYVWVKGGDPSETETATRRRISEPISNPRKKSQLDLGSRRRVWVILSLETINRNIPSTSWELSKNTPRQRKHQGRS